MRRHKKLVFLAFLMMIMLGFINNMRGTLIPPIKDFFAVSYSQIGIMLMASTFGFMSATFFGGLAASHFGLKKVIAFGFIAAALSIFTMGHIDSFFYLVILMILLGIGLGSVEIGANSLGAKIFVEKSGMMMNMLHLFFGVGASIGPRYAGWLLSLNLKWHQIYLTALVLIIFLLVYLFFTDFPVEVENDKKDNIAVKEIAKQKKVWLFSAVLGSAVVAEIAIGSWLVNFLHVERAFSTASASTYLSLFFVIFTVGRLVGGYFTEHLGYIKILFLFASATQILFICGLLIDGNLGAIFFSAAGFFISIMFPTIMAVIMREFDKGVSSYMGFIITSASAINMISNWLIGKINDLFNVFTGFASISVFIFLIIGFLYLLSKELNYNFAK
ncbi:MFS transporter [Halanaerobium kushneri]|uniref:Fucose permease n=1 Tax=Halanaerobium kushneri TaxID=56779 RepID=A0A1N7BXG0_9FIRM|nr:MFS transporter [Halanaerobium kushneri]SIR55986.1 Fucose permease [Halanaerobium kushneri]